MDESDMTTKNHLNAHILRSPWSEYPLPPLHRACRDGDMQSLIYLVTQGDRLEVFRSINEQDRFLLWTPAHWASYFGKLDCLRKLISSGLNIDVVDGRFNQTPAQLAAFAGHADVLLWLLQCGASTEKLDSLGENTAHKAVRSGSVECLSLLQATGAPMNSLNNRSQTPYEVAVSLGLENCGMLLQQFAIPSASKQRSLKRSLDDDMCCDEVKRQRNGKVQYSGHVELITPEYQQQNGLSSQDGHPDCFMNGNSEINHNHLANEVSGVHHNGFSNGGDNQSSLLLHNGFVNGDADMIETDAVDEDEVNDAGHTFSVDGADEAIKKEYLQHPHFTQRPRCVALCGHLI